jgi:hypothetical protein
VSKTIDQLIINSPYEEPKQYWSYDRESRTFSLSLKTGGHLILETKGQDTQQDKTKREFLDEWVNAVNAHGGFGKWAWAVSKNPADVKGIIEKVV